VDFESEALSTTDVKVTDQGTIYALMRSRFKNRAITNKHINYSYKVFLMNKDDFRSNPIDLPGDLTALHCRMVLRPEGIRCAGFHVQPEQTIKETSGTFVVDMDADLVPTGEMSIQPYPQPLEEQIMLTELLQRPDGGSFLVGGSWERSQEKVTERMLVVRSLDATRAVEWEQRIPRRLISEHFEDYGFRALQHNNRLIVCFPDDEDNLDLYRSGEEPKRKSSRDRIVISAAFDVDGKPTYARLGGGRNGDSFGAFDITDGHGAWFGYSSDMRDKKNILSGFGIIRME
jgi:hypothetical protein